MTTINKMGRNSGKSATPTTSTNAITLCGSAKEPRIDSRLMAAHLGIKHKAVMANIRSNIGHFRDYGILPFKKAVIAGRGQPETFALLNEGQGCFLLSLSRNTPRVVDLKACLVTAFLQARQRQDIRSAEYLPTYHAIHDEVARLADGSPNERFVHMNLNKLVNKAAGIESGQRPRADLPKLAMLTVAQHFAVEAMHGASDHKEGYALAKVALERLNAPMVEVAHV